MADPLFQGIPVAPEQGGTPSGQPLFQGTPVQSEQPATMGAGEDIARSIPSGIRRGFEGLAGQFGDLGEFSGAFTAWLAGKMGATPERQELGRQIGSSLTPFRGAPTTEDIQGVTSKIIGPPHEPQTPLGETARNISEFAPNMLSPGTLARRVAVTAVPAITSEVAGLGTRIAGGGKTAEQWARFVGGLAGGGASTGGRSQVTQRATRQAARGAPTVEVLRQQRNNFYDQLRSVGMQYDRGEFGQMVLGMNQNLRNAGFRESIAGPAFAYMRNIAQDFQNGIGFDFDDIDAYAKRIGGLARDARRAGNEQLAEAFDIMHDSIGDFELNSPISAPQGVPRAVINETRRLARNTALRSIRQRALQRIVDDAPTFASGEEVGIRNRIGVLLRSQHGRQLFPTGSAERRALNEVQHGRKAIRSLSRFGIDIFPESGNATLGPIVGSALVGGGTGALATGGAALPALAAAAALGGAGTIAKKASPALTQSAFDRAQAAIRSGNLQGAAGQAAFRDAQIEQLIRSGLIADVSATAATNE